MKRHVHPGSTIYTDLWKGYSDLTDLGYEHHTVNHSRYFKDPTTGVHTNSIDGLWNGIKTKIKPRNRCNDIDDRLVEFIWRKINQNKIWQEFLHCLSLPIVDSD